MMSTSFMELLRAQQERGRHVCIGLDTEVQRLPSSVLESNSNAQLAFNCAVIDATADVAAAYKPNAAFYECQGADGVVALTKTVAYIRRVAPDVPVILDAKRGDIGSSNAGYAAFAFDLVNAHALTVHPYLGSEAAGEFLSRKDRAIYVLCRTSNPGAGEFQDLSVRTSMGATPLFLAVASAVRDRWNTMGNCGLVVGATYPSELADVRAHAPDLPLLIPGIGSQGGDLAATVDAALGGGRLNALINSSRSIIFASSGPDFAEAARIAAIELDQQIQARL